MEIDHDQLLADGFQWKKILVISFSEQKGEVAILFLNKDDIAELWIMDVDLCNPDKVWVDTTGWIINSSNSHYIKPAKIVWGPSDNTVILSNNSTKNNIAIYDRITKKMHIANSDCSKFIKMSEKWSILCTNKEKNKSPIGYIINSNGVTESQSILEGTRSLSQDWAISPDGKKIVFLSNTKEIVIEDTKNALVNLDMSIDQGSNNILRATTDSRIFHWSMDGQQILIYGQPKDEQYCPKFVSLLDDTISEQSCWLLVNSNTGNIKWWLRREFVENIVAGWDGITTGFQAALSPDGRRVVLSVRKSAIRYLFVSSVDTISDIHTLQNASFTLVTWYSR
jgi:Tol biopolymer transport system component